MNDNDDDEIAPPKVQESQAQTARQPREGSEPPPWTAEMPNCKDHQSDPTGNPPVSGYFKETLDAVSAAERFLDYGSTQRDEQSCGHCEPRKWRRQNGKIRQYGRNDAITDNDQRGYKYGCPELANRDGAHAN